CPASPRSDRPGPALEGGRPRDGSGQPTGDESKPARRAHVPRVRPPGVPPASSSAARIARDAGPRRLEGAIAGHAARQRDRRAHRASPEEGRSGRIDEAHSHRSRRRVRPARGRAMMSWWRHRSIRVRLTLWYAAALSAVLALYAAGVFAFLRHSLSANLDQRLSDHPHVAEQMLARTPAGGIGWRAEPPDDADDDAPRGRAA